MQIRIISRYRCLCNESDAKKRRLLCKRCWPRGCFGKTHLCRYLKVREYGNLISSTTAREIIFIVIIFHQFSGAVVKEGTWKRVVRSSTCNRTKPEKLRDESRLHSNRGLYGRQPRVCKSVHPAHQLSNTMARNVGGIRWTYICGKYKHNHLVWSLYEMTDRKWAENLSGKTCFSPLSPGCPIGEHPVLPTVDWCSLSKVNMWVTFDVLGYHPPPRWTSCTLCSRKFTFSPTATIVWYILMKIVLHFLVFF